MSAYYNEIDPFCIEWLKNLIKKNLIADGDVDRVGKLRAYGNAIVPQVAAEFIRAFREIS